MANRFELIVFDWDGTLMDSEGRIVACLRATIDDLQLEERDNDSLKNIIGLGLPEAIEMIYPARDEGFHRRFVERYRHHFLGQGQTPAALFAGARAVVEQLESLGYLLAVATGKGRRGLDLVLEETGLNSSFVTTRCADESFSKPHPQMLQEIMDFCGIEPEKTLMVGDTEYDLQMAKSAGAAALAVSYGVHHPKRLQALEPLGCIDTIDELLPWLEQMNA